MRVTLLVAAATLLAAPAAAQAANPATVYAGKVANLHASQHTYPAGTTTRAACTGYAPYRTMTCRVTVSGAQLVNGGEVWRYVATGRIVRSGHSFRIWGFKAYAVAAIA